MTFVIKIVYLLTYKLLCTLFSKREFLVKNVYIYKTMHLRSSISEIYFTDSTGIS